MKILMLLEKEFPPDARVEKEALSLIKNGYEVHIASISLKKEFKSYENYNHIHIHRKYQSGFMKSKLSAAALVFPFYFRWWKRFVNEMFDQYSFDAIHVHDLPLSKVAYDISKKYHTKLVFDQHEYYSNWIVKSAHYNTSLGRIVNYLSNWRKYEKKYLNRADVVLTVEEPLKQCYVEQVRVPADKITCVPNTSRKTVFSYDNVDEQVVSKYKDRFVIFYAGGITKLKNVDTAIKALPQLVKNIPNITLLIAAKISKYVDPIGDAKKLGVDEYVDYVGYVPHEKVPSYIASSDVCFHVPPVYNEEVNRTIQTKIYQYILMHKPMIVGQAKLANEFVRENNIGLTIKESDPTDFAEKVVEMKTNNKLYHTMVENCKKLAQEKNWENTIVPMLNQYKSLLYES